MDRLIDPVLARWERAGELLVVGAPGILGCIEVNGHGFGGPGGDADVPTAAVGLDTGCRISKRDERAAVTVVEHGQAIGRFADREGDDAEHRVGALEADRRRHRYLAGRHRFIVADQLPRGVGWKVCQGGESGTVLLGERGAVVLREKGIVLRTFAQEPPRIHDNETTSAARQTAGLLIHRWG